MKTKIYILALAVMLLLTGCADIKKLQQLKADFVGVENLSTRGLTGVDLVLVLDVDNPGAQFSLSEISGTIEQSGKVLGKVALDPFTIEGKTAGRYNLNVDMTLGEGVNIFNLARLLDKAALDQITVDLSADVQLKKGKARKMEINDLPLKKLIETVK